MQALTGLSGDFFEHKRLTQQVQSKLLNQAGTFQSDEASRLSLASAILFASGCCLGRWETTLCVTAAAGLCASPLTNDMGV